MTIVSRTTREVASRTYEFDVEEHPDLGLRVKAKDGADPKTYAPLTDAVAHAFNQDAGRLIRSAVERKGWGMQGVIGFAFNDDYPDEPPGVSAYHMDDEVTVTERWFAELVAAVGAVYLEAAQASGRPPGDIDAPLKQLREQIAGGRYAG